MKKSDQSHQTKEAILASAQLLFAKTGYESASVASICESAGVSKGAFYHHFPSKQAIFFELMRRWSEDLEQRLTEIESGEAEVPNRLLSMAQVVGEVLKVGGPQLSIYLEFWNQAIRDREVYDAMRTPFNDFMDFFSGLIQEGMQSGTLRAADSEMTARIILSIGIGLLFQGLLDPEAADWNEVTTFGLKILFEGLYSESTS
jgi:AcrR family transcriptional regulator